MSARNRTTYGIGHNQGPSLLAGSWSGQCWKRARRQVWDNPPIEVIRSRKRRAEELGLSYKQYAGILLDKGVRTEAMVFALTEMPARPSVLAHVSAKLKTLRRCTGLAASAGPPGLIEDVDNRAGGVFADWAAYPITEIPSTKALLQPVLDMLGRQVLQPSATVMVGDGNRAWQIGQSARLARVFPAAAYF